MIIFVIVKSFENELNLMTPIKIIIIVTCNVIVLIYETV